ncbi:hypothetical protein ACFL2C_03970 [Patescibacteria group bacterium]
MARQTEEENCITTGEGLSLPFRILSTLGEVSFRMGTRLGKGVDTGASCGGRGFTRLRGLELASRASINGIRKYDVRTVSQCSLCDRRLKCRVSFDAESS